MILATVGQTIMLAQAEFESKRSRRPAAEEAAPAEAQPAEAAPVAAVPVEAAPQATA
jgi:predicted lipid-binding transport protein (Tim44 family)